MRRYIITFLSVFSFLAVLHGTGICYETDYGNFSSRYERQKGDYLKVRTVDDRVVAFRNKRPSAPINLDLGEEVRMTNQKGHMGAVVTDRRFMAISSVSDAWLSEPLELGESASTDLMVGEEIVILVTNERIIGFNGVGNRFIEFSLGIGDDVIAFNVGVNLGVVVMSDRAVGLAAESGDFVPVEFDFRGTFRSLEMAATLALVHTDKNIYVFQASSGAWSVKELPITE
jgi:hypothetical protein